LSPQQGTTSDFLADSEHQILSNSTQSIIHFSSDAAQFAVSESTFKTFEGAGQNTRGEHRESFGPGRRTTEIWLLSQNSGVIWMIEGGRRLTLIFADLDCSTEKGGTQLGTLTGKFHLKWKDSTLYHSN
jgi:hypothetical protein